MAMQQNKKEVDIINEILEECILAYPVSSFIISLYKHYIKWNSLSKKQLQGLHSKASNIPTLSSGKLATLEALIKKMPTRYKSELPENKSLYNKEDSTGDLINSILNKYPNHKRVLFLKSKFENNEPLSPIELNELKKFSQILK